jgi:hypothetical protein
MNLSRRHLLAGAALGGAGACLPFWSGRAVAAAGAVTPEQFGAKGDGVSNDSAAFAAMAAHVNAQGGGEIVLRRTTYIIGRQTQAFRRGTSFAFEPAKIMEFTGCTRPLVIRGNGAVIRTARGLRYGTFNPVSGAKTSNRMPYVAPGEIASPYRCMILAQDCSGPVEIENLELDGNVKALSIGGGYGDIGWQIPATGICLVDNRGPERLTRIYSHHHAQDGIMIDGTDRSRGPGVRSLLVGVRCEYNGRQGVSLVGGRGYDFRDCTFSHTGKAGISSPPGGGVDIEAEAGKKIRDVSFSGCTFSNNAGAGLVADSGDSEDARFTACTFVGATNWAAWPNKPRFRFDRCNFVGPIVRAFGDPNPARATQFYDCTFRDDPALSPTRTVYGGENRDRPIADLPSNLNVLFSRCKFLLTHQAVLPWSTNVTYSDCTLSQRSTTGAYPRGLYVGRNVITGRVGLSGSTVRGELIVNGARVPAGKLA